MSASSFQVLLAGWDLGKPMCKLEDIMQGYRFQLTSFGMNYSHKLKHACAERDLNLKK